MAEQVRTPDSSSGVSVQQSVDSNPSHDTCHDKGGVFFHYLCNFDDHLNPNFTLLQREMFLTILYTINSSPLLVSN